MRLLLDTHALIWWALDLPRLGRAAYAAIDDATNTVSVSAATAFEIATKHRIGKLPQAAALLADLPGYLMSQDFGVLPVTLDHALQAGALPGPHRDPFDRLLMAQALSDDLTVATQDPVFAHYGVRVVW
ncbi:MAG: type II toxin-antitoxin system VapC family toxin [Pseudomonadota bacterium]